MLRPRKFGIGERPFPWTGGTRSLLRVTLIAPSEMNPGLKHNKGRAQNSLNGEMKNEVISVPFQEGRPESPSSNLSKTAEGNGRADSPK